MLCFPLFQLCIPHGCHSSIVLLTEQWRSSGLTGNGRWICLIRSRERFLSGGIPTRSPPDRFDESLLPLYSWQKTGGFNQMHHCSMFQRYQRHFTNERRDISTSTSAWLYPTGCRCDSSFCLVDKVNRIQWWRKFSNISLLDANTTVS